MKVYAFADGEYSDFTVLGIFSTRELAEAHQAKKEWKCPQVLEYEVDELKDDELRTIYHVSLDIAGNLENQYQHASVCAEIAEGQPFFSNSLKFSGTSTTSLEHALKLAAEARQAWLRETA